MHDTNTPAKVSGTKVSVLFTCLTVIYLWVTCVLIVLLLSYLNDAPPSTSEIWAKSLALCGRGCFRGLLLSLRPPFASADKSRATAVARFSPSRPNGALPSLKTSSVGLELMLQSLETNGSCFSWSFALRVQTKQRQEDSPPLPATA